ncbi:MAG: hypothetical protein GF411_19005 [Candidatus Lokiarchaeota archaeon]|nr:hypothetical protein [Candidatus Lokiarchaeota archaeon]
MVQETSWKIEGRFVIPSYDVILYEFWCLHCGSPIFGIKSAVISNEEPELITPYDLSLVKFECVLCRKKVEVENLQIRYKYKLQKQLKVSSRRKLRMPDNRPFEYVLLCSSCGGQLYGIRDNDIYPKKDGIQAKILFTFTDFKCIKCGEIVHFEKFGIKYNNKIIEKFGWPIGEFPQPKVFKEKPSTQEFSSIYFDSKVPEIDEETPTSIPADETTTIVRLGYISMSANSNNELSDTSPTEIEDSPVEERPIKLDPQFWKEIEHFIKSRGGRPTDRLSSTRRITTYILEKWNRCYIAEITEIGGKYGLRREWQNRIISGEDYAEGTVIEVGGTTVDGLKRRIYYRVEDDMFIPFIQTWRK